MTLHNGDSVAGWCLPHQGWRGLVNPEAVAPGGGWGWCGLAALRWKWPLVWTHESPWGSERDCWAPGEPPEPLRAVVVVVRWAWFHSHE